MCDLACANIDCLRCVVPNQTVGIRQPEGALIRLVRVATAVGVSDKHPRSSSDLGPRGFGIAIRCFCGEWCLEAGPARLADIGTFALDLADKGGVGENNSWPVQAGVHLCKELRRSAQVQSTGIEIIQLNCRRRI